MNTLFQRSLLTFAVAVSCSFFSAPAHALTKQDLINEVSNLSETDVLQRLMSTGVGKCRVKDGTAIPACACNYYFATGHASAHNYFGAPIYNTDCATSGNPAGCSQSGYAGSSNASRVANVASNVRDSTGCFAGVGGLKGNPSIYWPGNNSDEASLSKETYAKKVLLRMMADTADPCKLNDYIAAVSNASNAFSTETAVAGGGAGQQSSQQSAGNMFAFSTSTGVMNPRKCRQRINETTWTPYGHFSELACLTIYRRILSKGQTPLEMPAANVATMPYANSAAYVQSLVTSNNATFLEEANLNRVGGAGLAPALNPDTLYDVSTCGAVGGCQPRAVAGNAPTFR